MPKKENYPVIDKVTAQKYAADFNIPHELAQIIAVRFPAYNEAKRFLFPDIKDLHDPWSLPDIEKAVDITIETIKNNEKILIYCHDDPDGYTSAAIMYQCLIDITKGMNDRVFVYPIVREKDGYILNPEVLRRYRDQGVKLVITVDFGISSLDNFKICGELGLKIVVCDHHETNRSHFPAAAVDPKRPDAHYPFRELAGVGVSYKLAQALYEKGLSLKSNEFYSLKKSFFPLLMIGTISDRVVLLDENRIFSTHGLSLFKRLDTPWIKYFREISGQNTAGIPGQIIPLIGSAAYVDPDLAIEIFLSNDLKRVSDIIEILQSVNTERQKGIEELMRAAISAAKIYPRLIISIIPFLKQHYLGTVAARLKEQYNRTSVVIGLKDGICYGELRSKELDLFKILNGCSSLFLDFGGHRQAAGFSMRESNLDEFVNRLIKDILDPENIDGKKQGEIMKAQPVFPLERTKIDFLQALTPFGTGNPAPLLTDGSNIYTIDNKFRIVEKELDGQS
jgi:single-stranded-DNA-specific exonuclease